ncbi:MAG: YlbF family regulator [Bacteroidia bacterium]|nr:YlbF family regulator [Bacteroidia bacterium]
MMILMNEVLLEKIRALRSAIHDDERCVLLINKEKAMESNPDVMRLAYHKDLAEAAYNDALRHYGQDSTMAKQAQKELFLAKSELDKHPFVKEYLAAYQSVRLLYTEINAHLFAAFKEHSCEDKKS